MLGVELFPLPRRLAASKASGLGWISLLGIDGAHIGLSLNIHNLIEQTWSGFVPFTSSSKSMGGFVQRLRTSCTAEHHRRRLQQKVTMKDH